MKASKAPEKLTQLCLQQQTESVVQNRKCVSYSVCPEEFLYLCISTRNIVYKEQLTKHLFILVQPLSLTVTVTVYFIIENFTNNTFLNNIPKILYKYKHHPDKAIKM